MNLREGVRSLHPLDAESADNSAEWAVAVGTAGHSVDAFAWGCSLGG